MSENFAKNSKVLETSLTDTLLIDKGDCVFIQKIQPVHLLLFLWHCKPGILLNSSDSCLGVKMKALEANASGKISVSSNSKQISESL